MATLLSTPVPGFEKKPEESFEAYMNRAEALLNDMLAASARVTDGKVEGSLVSFPVADGKAWYLVKSEKPLRLQHIPFGDAYQADCMTIRGMRLADVQEHVRRSRALSALFQKRRGVSA